MRQAKNIVEVEGYLNACELRYFTKDGSTARSLVGDIEIAVPMGEEVDENGNLMFEIIPVNVFVNELKRDGKPNPAWRRLEELKESFKSIANTGSYKEADKIRTSSATISINDFYGQTGTLISQTRIQASFFNRVTAEFAPQKIFKVEMVVGAVAEEIDTEGNETGRLKVKGIIPGFNGRIDVVDFVVRDKVAMNHIKNNWKEGDTVDANGYLNFNVSQQKIVEEQGFGEPVVTVRSIAVRELIIAGGSANGKGEEEGAFDNAEITKALEERKVRLEALKAKSASKNTKPATSTFKADDLGF